MSVDYDVIIAGGGMVGISFALALDRLSAGALRILVAESFAIPASSSSQTLQNSPPTYRPSFDARTTALSYGSRCILQNLGIWSALETHTTAIGDIHVSERGHLGSVILNNEQRGWPALGYVVENPRLGNVLLNRLRQCPAITLISPAKVVDCEPGAQHATVTIEHEQQRKTFSTHLLSIADGADSQLRTRLNIGNTTHDYRHQAVIANISCSRAHGGWAYERFTDWGPMALLPLSDSEQGQPRMALVWTMPRARAAQLIDCSERDFLDALQQRFGQRQGQFIRVGERLCYDLKLITADEQIRRQIALIGNAAHSLHPVAGQGFNLALRDVSRLAEIIAHALATGETIGDLNVLQRYINRQANDQWKTTLFSDRITALFEQPNIFVRGLRRAGLLALDLNVDWKNYFTNQSAGYHPGAALATGI